jgi:hypothetical protein
MEYKGIANDPNIPNNPNAPRQSNQPRGATPRSGNTTPLAASVNNNNNSSPFNTPPPRAKDDNKKKTSPPQAVSVNDVLKAALPNTNVMALNEIEKKALVAYVERHNVGGSGKGEDDDDENGSSDEESKPVGPGSKKEEQQQQQPNAPQDKKGKKIVGVPLSGSMSPSTTVDYAKDTVYMAIYKKYIRPYVTTDSYIKKHIKENNTPQFKTAPGTHRCVAKIQVDLQPHVYKRCPLLATDRPFVLANDQKGPPRYCVVHSPIEGGMYDAYKTAAPETKVDCNELEGYVEVRKKVDGLEKAWCLRKSNQYLFFWEQDQASSMDAGHNQAILITMNSYTACNKILAVLPPPEIRPLLPSNVKSSALQVSTDITSGVVLKPVPSDEDIEEARKIEERKKENAKKNKKKKSKAKVKKSDSKDTSGTNTPDAVDINRTELDNERSTLMIELVEMSVKSQRRKNPDGTINIGPVRRGEKESVQYDMATALDDFFVSTAKQTYLVGNYKTTKMMEQKLLNMSIMTMDLLKLLGEILSGTPDAANLDWLENIPYHLESLGLELDSFDLRLFITSYFSDSPPALMEVKKTVPEWASGMWRDMVFKLPYTWYDGNGDYDMTKYILLKYGVGLKDPLGAKPDGSPMTIQDLLNQHELYKDRIKVDTTSKHYKNIMKFFMHPYVAMARSFSMMYYLCHRAVGLMVGGRDSVHSMCKSLDNYALADRLTTLGRLCRLDVFLQDVKTEAVGNASLALATLRSMYNFMNPMDVMYKLVEKDNINKDSILVHSLTYLGNVLEVGKARFSMLDMITDVVTPGSINTSLSAMTSAVTLISKINDFVHLTCWHEIALGGFTAYARRYFGDMYAAVKMKHNVRSKKTGSVIIYTDSYGRHIDQYDPSRLSDENEKEQEKIKLDYVKIFIEDVIEEGIDVLERNLGLLTCMLPESKNRDLWTDADRAARSMVFNYRCYDMGMKPINFVCTRMCNTKYNDMLGYTSRYLTKRTMRYMVCDDELMSPIQQMIEFLAESIEALSRACWSVLDDSVMTQGTEITIDQFVSHMKKLRDSFKEVEADYVVAGVAIGYEPDVQVSYVEDLKVNVEVFSFGKEAFDKACIDMTPVIDFLMNVPSTYCSYIIRSINEACERQYSICSNGGGVIPETSSVPPSRSSTKEEGEGEVKIKSDEKEAEDSDEDYEKDNSNDKQQQQEQHPEDVAYVVTMNNYIQTVNSKIDTIVKPVKTAYRMASWNHTHQMQVLLEFIESDIIHTVKRCVTLVKMISDTFIILNDIITTGDEWAQGVSVDAKKYILPFKRDLPCHSKRSSMIKGVTTFVNQFILTKERIDTISKFTTSGPRALMDRISEQLGMAMEMLVNFSPLSLLKFGTVEDLQKVDLAKLEKKHGLWILHKLLENTGLMYQQYLITQAMIGDRAGKTYVGSRKNLFEAHIKQIKEKLSDV